MSNNELKKARYQRLFVQLEEILGGSPSLLSQLASVNAVLYHKIPYVFWIGFYIVHNEQLIVGPYQGPLACQSLPYPEGACWSSVIHKKSIIIPDVHRFPGHISCDARSKSELVIPILYPNKSVYGVLDLDSDRINAFDETDKDCVSRITGLINVAR
jgi:L-methionine (R)-S-oxide reductase